MEIAVDFEVFKALTARLEFDGQTHNDVLRDLLMLDSIAEETASAPAILNAFEGAAQAAESWARPADEGFFSRGLFLPEGTLIRARYKGDEYTAEISNGRWIDQNGDEQSSPSAAASAITGNNVNGLRFWEAKRPRDGSWRRLEFHRNSAAHSHG